MSRNNKNGDAVIFYSSFFVPSQICRSLPPFPTFVDGEWTHNFILNSTSINLSDEKKINIKQCKIHVCGHVCLFVYLTSAFGLCSPGTM